MAGILCAGDLFWDRRDDQGKSTGLVHMGNATSFSITEASSIKERTSKQVASYGQVLDSVPIKGASKIAITLDELNKANLALIHLGEEAVKSIEAATGKTKIFDLSKIETDVFYEIGAKLITVASVKIDTADMDTTLYEINAAGGLIKFSEKAPAIGSVTVTYSNAAAKGFAISGSAKPTIKGRLLLIGKNLADQSNVHVDVLEAVLTPKSGLDYLSSDFASAQFEGTLNTPAGESSPYTVTVLEAA